jgi:hypothetical protein
MAQQGVRDTGGWGYYRAVRRLKRKHVVRSVAPVANLSKANQEWSMDFVSDGLATGRACAVSLCWIASQGNARRWKWTVVYRARRVTRVLDWVIE